MRFIHASALAALVLVSWGAACSHSPEGFCEGWVEDTCQAITTCCESGKKFDLQECRKSLSSSCQKGTQVELVHAGVVVFDRGAAKDCFGSIESCADVTALAADETFEHKAACANVVTGYRPLGAACSDDSECQSAGDYADCYHGVCVAVVLDEEKCSFSFDTFERHVCADDHYCDSFAYKPNPNDPPSIQEAVYSGSCKPNISAGGSCFDGEHLLPCAKGLYCEPNVSGSTPTGTCVQRKAAGASCSYSVGGDVCAEGLYCEPNSNGEGTCQASIVSASFCYSPAVCGDGHCEGAEDSSTCPQDCGGGDYCGDGYCGDTEDEYSCPDDCGSYCGDGTCDATEDVDTCPEDCY